MMDIAHYFNDSYIFDNVASKQLPKNINCDSHYDPGLFSFSVLSTAPGLELFDFSTNTWVQFDNYSKGQTDKGIIWCGKAANFANSLFHPCVHRVTRSLDTPRTAMWYEICQSGQGTFLFFIH
jgi:hypothetical protein